MSGCNRTSHGQSLSLKIIIIIKDSLKRKFLYNTSSTAFGNTPPGGYAATPLIEGGCVALFQYSPRHAFGMSPQQSTGLLRSPLDCFALMEGGMKKMFHVKH